MTRPKMLPLPEPGGQRTAARRVAWPTLATATPWTCLSARPHLWATHWCPGMTEKGSETKGRSVPCWEQGCPRCDRPRDYPPDQKLTFSCLDPRNDLTVCILPGHMANRVIQHPNYTGDWRGAILLCMRLSTAPTAGVWLFDLEYADPDSLPFPHDDVAVMEKIWEKFLPQNGSGAKWCPLGDREPGEEG